MVCFKSYHDHIISYRIISYHMIHIISYHIISYHTRNSGHQYGMYSISDTTELALRKSCRYRRRLVSLGLAVDSKAGLG